MKNNSLKKHKTWLKLGCAGVLLVSNAAAFAQSDADKDEDTSQIVVTGTSIRGVSAPGANTLQLDNEAIQETGAANISQATRTLPVVLNIGPDESRTGGAQDAAANSSRISAINLRGLGPEATLVLLNGRRLPAGGILRALVDPNSVPTLATQRLEVVLDGASAIYGADAVAGVVNIITRRNFNGFETSGRYGFGDDIDEIVLNQNAGTSWGSGDVFAAFEYNHRSHLLRSSRDFLSQDLRARGGTDQRSTQSPDPNIVINNVRYPVQTDGVGPANRYDDVHGDFLPETERYNGLLSVHQDLAHNVRIWAEGLYSRRYVDTLQSPLGAAFTVPSSNAFYRSGLAGAPAGAPQRIEYRLPRDGAVSRSKESTAQIAAGADWDITSEWQLSTYWSHNIYDGKSGLGSEQINNFAAAIALASSDPATALNVYGGTIPDSVYDQIIGFRQQWVNFRSDHFEAKLDGPLFTLPAGDVRAAIGASHELDEFRYREYQSVLSSTNTPSVTNDATNRRNITSVYGELFVPLVSDAPFAKRLTLSAAVRYDDYSDFGSTTNPKISATWDPIDGISFRGTWGKSFRAPSLVDTGNLNFAFIFPVPDPTQGNALINQLLWTGSNPNLKPEKAESWSIGADLRPDFLPGFTAGITYFKVDYRNRIEGVSASLANEAIYSQFIIRNPPLDTINYLYNSGWLVTAPIDPNDIDVLVDGRRNNVGSMKMEGLDVNVNYEFPVSSLGVVSAGITHSQIFHVYRQTFPALPVTDVVDLFENPLRSKGRANLGFRSGGFNANLFYNYGGTYTNTAVIPNVKASPQKTFDLTLRYSFADEASILGGTTLQLSATNLFDKDPPIVINGASSWDNTTASGIGRFVSIAIQKKW